MAEISIDATENKETESFVKAEGRTVGNLLLV